MPLLAKPTPQQLAWQDMEMGALFTVTPAHSLRAPRSRVSVLLTGALFQYNMGTYGEGTNDEDCGPTLSSGTALPPATSFDAPRLNVSQW